MSGHAVGPFGQALMRALATAPDGLTSASLVSCATAQAGQQGRQAQVNTVLGRLQARGYVTRSAKRVPTGTNGRQSAYVWQITEAGRRALPPLDGES